MIGNNAGYNTQEINSVAIGYSAGQYNQGQNSVAIGNLAGPTSGSVVYGTGVTGGFYVKPINVTASTTNALVYNTVTSEIAYNTSKTFVIDHPIDKNKYLVHACLEGPEAGVYYRGKSEIVNNDFVEIILPDYVDLLATEFTIQITEFVLYI
jgi:hypothetical protein